MVSWQAQNGGADHFSLRDKNAIQDFIGSGGIVNCKFQRTDLLRNWPEDKPGRPAVDSYTFVSNKLEGYIAFYRNPAGQWFLKSFKPSTPPPAPAPKPISKKTSVFSYLPFADLRKRLMSAAEKKDAAENENE